MRLIREDVLKAKLLSEWVRNIEKVDAFLEELPGYQPPHWIPVSERLPDTDGDVLLQFDNSMGVGFWSHDSWVINTGDNIYSEVGEREAQPIAWMPLPEPYAERITK